MINRFHRLRGHGVFRDFTWPSDLPDFERYNLVYGWNGTGKTTLSKLLRRMEEPVEDPPDGDVVVRIDGTNHEGPDLGVVEVPIKVFNRDFRDEAVFQRDGGMAPIFVLGKENVEKQKEAERLKVERGTAQHTAGQEKRHAKRAKSELDKFGTNQAKTVRESLRSPGKNPFNNFQRPKYVEIADKMLTDGSKDSWLLENAIRDALLKQSKDQPKDKLTTLAYDLPSLSEYESRAEGLLIRTVVTETLTALRDDGVLASWVQTGLGIHQERNADRCLFCDQPLPSERVEALERHFSDELKRLQGEVDKLVADLEQEEQVLDTIVQALPKKVEFDNSLAPEYGTAESGLKDSVAEMRRHLGALRTAVDAKRNQPFDRVALSVPTPNVDEKALEKINDIVQRHNTICDEFDKRVNQARRKLAASLVASSLDEYKAKKKDQESHEAKSKEADKCAQDMDRQIAKLESEIQENRKPAEELNADLFQYLGHDELKLQIEDNGYAIQRKGTPVEDTLSEGEQTAIALLYFLKSLKDRRFDIQNGIVVLDDPVSSLDSNALFAAFGFIRERLGDAGQIFIMTHNFTLFRQVKNWFKYVPGGRKKNGPCRFYMTKCGAGQDGKRVSEIAPLDPLLMKYESEYHYLFARVHEAATADGNTPLATFYDVPNIARRVLEIFLAFRQPDNASGLWDKVQGLKNTDDPVKHTVIRFLHSFSHDNMWEVPDHDPFILGEGKEVMSAVVSLMEAEDPTHVEAMRRILPQAEEFVGAPS